MKGKSLFLVVSLLISLYIPNSSYATTSQVVQEDDEDQYDFIAQLKDASEEVASAKLKIKAYRVDKIYYNHILKVILKMLNPSSNKFRGDQSIRSALALINELIRIHKNEIYLSESKRKKLRELLATAHEIRSRIKKLPQEKTRICLSKINLADYEPEVQQFILKMASGKKKIIQTVGVNVSVAATGGLQGGLCIGQAVTPYGFRRMVIGGSGGVMVTPHVAIMAEYASREFPGDSLVNTSRCKLVGGGNVRGGVGLCGGIGAPMNEDRIESAEVGIGLLIGAGIRGTVLGEVLPLPNDLKRFRNNIGLFPESGLL